MRNFILFYVFIFFAIARSEDECDVASYTNMALEKVDINSECSSVKPCIVKCCPENQVYFRHKMKSKAFCKNVDDIQKDYSQIDWSNIPFKNYSGLNFYEKVDDVTPSSKKIDSFKILQSVEYRLLRPQCVRRAFKPSLMANGKMILGKINADDKSPRQEYGTSFFCVEMHVYLNMSIAYQNFFYMLRQDYQKENNSKNLFVAITYTISSFFLVLVLIVYPMTDMLKNMQGMLLFTYSGTLLVAQLIKACYNFATIGEEEIADLSKKTDCTLIFQFYYFFVLASFFWLNVMSFDIWWTFRGKMKNRAIHRRGIKVKFMMYALYVYGAPAAMTTFAVVVDRQPSDVLSGITRPEFTSCLAQDAIFFYFFVPVMILTGLNIVWFLLTVFNIWQTKNAIVNFDRSAQSKQSKNGIKLNKDVGNPKNKQTFWVYIRLSLLMGISWCIELGQIKSDDLPLWGYVLLNLYTVLTGLVIFIMFVCKRDVLHKLSKRLNIENRWTRRLLASSRSDSNKTTWTSNSRSTNRSKVTDLEPEEPPATNHTERYMGSQKQDVRSCF